MRTKLFTAALTAADLGGTSLETLVQAEAKPDVTVAQRAAMNLRPNTG